MQQFRLESRTVRRAVKRYGASPVDFVGPLDQRLVFVVGCPRSGTSFTGSALGDVKGFADLGEVNRLKASVPRLFGMSASGRSPQVVRELRRILRRTQRLSASGGRRPVEQTPECSFLVRELAEAFPHSRFIHLVRDGRDVAASLIATGWLTAPARAGADSTRPALFDDAGLPLGAEARFWVEAGRQGEFEAASEARRAAWAWRRYVTAASTATSALPTGRTLTVRYEDLAYQPREVARQVAHHLQVPHQIAEFSTAFSKAHTKSVGRHKSALRAVEENAILDEAGDLLLSLGYLRAQSG